MAYQGGAKRIELNSALFLGGLTPEINGIILIFSLIASMFADNAIYVSENAKEMQFRKKICHKIYGI